MKTFKRINFPLRASKQKGTSLFSWTTGHFGIDGNYMSRFLLELEITSHRGNSLNSQEEFRAAASKNGLTIVDL
jgi:hypothetical protein